MLGHMDMKRPYRFVAARVTVNIIVALVMYMVTIPNCYVPAIGSRQAYFAWDGLVPTTVFVGLCTFALWLKR